MPDERKEILKDVNWELLRWYKSHGLEGKTSGRSWRLQNSQATNSRYSACPNLQEKELKLESRDLEATSRANGTGHYLWKGKDLRLNKHTKHFQLSSAQTRAHMSAQGSLHSTASFTLCTEDSSSFGRDPCHPSAHCSTGTSYMRGIQHLHFPQTSEMHKKAHFWRIYNKIQNAAIPTALKKHKTSVRSHTVIKIPNRDQRM